MGRRLLTEWKYDSKIDAYYWLINTKMLGRIEPHKGKYRAVYLEWRKERWPADLFDSSLGGFAQEIMMRGDAYEIEIGQFKAAYQAREALEQYIRSKNED